MFRRSLDSTLNFSKYDVKANRRGMFSAEQRDMMALIDDSSGAARKSYGAGFVERITTQTMPQIREVTGFIDSISHTRYVPGTQGDKGRFVETFHLIVYGENERVELPVNPDAVNVFEPNRPYTVYYYLNRETPRLLSVHPAG